MGLGAGVGAWAGAEARVKSLRFARATEARLGCVILIDPCIGHYALSSGGNPVRRVWPRGRGDAQSITKLARREKPPLLPDSLRHKRGGIKLVTLVEQCDSWEDPRPPYTQLGEHSPLHHLRADPRQCPRAHALPPGSPVGAPDPRVSVRARNYFTGTQRLAGLRLSSQRHPSVST